MPSNDFSQDHFNSKKKYKSVQNQQGRVELDSNEGALLKGQLRDLIEEVKPKVVLTKSIKDDKIAKGCGVIFHGATGSGKQSAAELIAKELQKELYKVDLSMIVSKYIGETEKNLNQVFARAEDKDWILFFDEADALFKKRTNVGDAHDRYANKEVVYLLQRIENYAGLVILAVNSDVDKDVIERFHSVIKFPLETK